MKSSLFYPSACTVGEGPLWHVQRRSCFWVDIEGKAFYEAGWETPGPAGDRKITRWQLDRCVSAVVPSEEDHVVIALEGGLARFRLSTGSWHWLTDLGLDWNSLRCNDGKCDDKGRLWIGTTEMKHRKAAGALYCVDAKGVCRKMLDGQTIANGMAWSPDHRRFYYTDSVTREIGSYVYDAPTGTIGFEKTAVVIPPEMGVPDGMAMDAEGMLWIALWGGYGVGRWDPHTGRQLDFVEVPAPQVTSCAFAGNELDRLIITTARRDMGAEALEQYPGSGHVFVAGPGVKGMPCSRCAL